MMHTSHTIPTQPLTKTSIDQHDILKVTDIQQLARAAAAFTAVCATLLEGGCLEEGQCVDSSQAKNFDNLISNTTGISTEDNDMQQRKVKIGYTEDGRPIYKHLEARNQDEMNDKIVATILASGRYTEFIGGKRKEKTKFKPYAEKWLKSLTRKKKASNTIKTHQSALTAHILPTFGDRYIEDITWEDIQKWLDALEDYARRSVEIYLVTLSMVLKKAKEEKLIDTNPAESSELVIEATKKTERHALTPEQQASIISNLDKLNPQEQCMIALYMTTGIRKGELLGLEWSAVDFETGFIHIVQQSDYNNGGKLIPPKRGSKGKVQMAEWVKAILLMNRKESGFVLEGKTKGKPLPATTYERRMKAVESKIELFGATGHVFRHTAITTVYHSCKDPKTAQAFARHRNIKTTMDIYVDPLENELRQSASAFDHLVNIDSKSA